MILNNNIIRKGVTLLLITALILSGLFSYPNATYADKIVLSEETYYHLDMGVQVAYNPGSSWGSDNIYGSSTPISVGTTIHFNNDIEVIDTYPLESGKGSSFDFSGSTSSHNIPKALGDASWAYMEYYNNYASTSMTEGSNSSSGKTVSFSYTAKLNTPSPLEVVSYGKNGNDQEIYQLFGGKSALEKDQPRIADAIAVALKAGLEGTAGNNKLYLIFCPNVIEYKKYIIVGDLEAQLSLPSTAKQNESYTAADASFVDSSLTVEEVVLEKHYGDGAWQPAASWPGRGPGANSGGSIQEKEEKICAIAYRLIVTTTDGQTDTDIKTINITDGRDFDGEADLFLPKYSYEGHPVEADDFSTFTVDGEFYSARRMYEEELASNTFKPQTSASATMRRLNLTSVEITFPKQGTYNVVLEVKTKDGKVLTDTEYIDIYKTPKIAATLSGRQKENRKQSLNLSVATYPGCPITELWVELESEDGKEIVRLYKDGSLNNSETIKTRAIVTESITQYFSKYRLDFLTKNIEEKEYRYTVYAKDSRGYTDQVSETFIVAPDLPPNAVISVEDSFIRNKGTDVATVTMEDESTTDGDQVERTWYVKSREGNYETVKEQPGYKDLSFGTEKRVSFNRTGVGKVDLKLNVKDVWTEETLQEYITEDDYKSSSTINQTDIVNIAPVVSIAPIHTKTAGILILAAGQEEYNFLNANKNNLMEKLIEKGIDGEILIEKMVPQAATDGSLGYTNLLYVSLPVGFNADTTFLENHFHMVDNETLYTINATWTGSYHDVFPEMPYYITAWDPYTRQEKWSYTLTNDVMSIAKSGTKSQKGFTQDDQGKYLFFRYGGETLVLSKDNGAYLTKLNVELGDENYLANNAIYTIKEDGIYSVSAETGNVKKVYSGTIPGKTKKLNNAIHFLAHTGPMTINRGELNLSGETLKMTRILGTENDAIGTNYTCIGIDIDGVMMVGINNSASVRVYGSDNGHIKTISGWGTGYRYSVLPAYDEKGKCEYLVSAYQTKGSSYYYDQAAAFGVYDDYYTSYEYRSSGWRADPGYPMYAGRMGDKLYYQLGAMWAGLYGGGSVMPHYTEYASLYTFDLKTKAVTRGTSDEFAFGAAGEYGSTSEALFAPSYSYNLDQQELHENGLNTKVVAWNQSIDDILSRYLNKSGLASKELNTIFLYDNSNENAIHPMGLSLNYLKEKDVDFIFAMDPERAEEDEPKESYGKRLVEALQEAGQRAATLVRDSTFLNRIAALIAWEEDTPKTVLSIHNASGSGESSISREYTLKANKTYFYEYEIKTSTMSAVGQPFRVDYETMREVPEESLLQEGYVVAGMEEEDFNDKETNPFFTLDPSRIADAGTYNLATLNSGKTSLPNSTFSDASDIIFHVPEGKKAILTFTYNVRSHGGNWANATIMINGERYHRLQYQNPVTGTYTHHEFLPEGENRLRGYAVTYGTRPMSSWAIIDDLKVIYVERDEISNSEISKGETANNFTRAKLEENWTRYNGILKTPYETTAYRGQPIEYVFQDFSSDNDPYISKDISNPDRKALKITIPEGKYSIDTGVNVQSTPRISGNNNYNVTFSWNGNTWTDMADTSYGGVNSDIPSPFRIVMNTIQGTQNLTSVARAYNGTSADYTSVELQIVDELNGPINEGKYFFDKENEIVYLDNDKYLERGMVTISGGDDESWQLRDFKIYSIEKGVKVYVTGEDIKKTSEINKWTMNNAVAALCKETKQTTEEEIASVAYKKGQLVAYDIFYTDYENDPGKKQYWRYTHTPFSDGPHPDAAVILDTNGSPSAITGKVLDSSIPRFYIDGKYTVEHWQEDNTTRGLDPDGNPDYDKASNIETLTFYVEGTANAPWITLIETIPGTVKEGESYKIRVGVDDLEKDVLNLNTEVYKERRLIYSHRKTGITADQSGNYPYTLTGETPTAVSGTYEIICTASDETGTGLGTYRFVVTTDGKITGYVNHTDQWDINRKKYNLKRFGQEVNWIIPFEEYVVLPEPRMRGINVFWSGEKFLLEAVTEGKPKEVKVSVFEENGQGLRRDTGYHTQLKKEAKEKNDGEWWTGELWQSSMINRWGRKTPQKLVVVFEALYEGNKVKSCEEEIIIDSNRDYWQLHRLW